MDESRFGKMSVASPHSRHVPLVSQPEPASRAARKDGARNLAAQVCPLVLARRAGPAGARLTPVCLCTAACIES